MNIGATGYEYQTYLEKNRSALETYIAANRGTLDKAYGAETLIRASWGNDITQSTNNPLPFMPINTAMFNARYGVLSHIALGDVYRSLVAKAKSIGITLNNFDVQNYLLNTAVKNIIRQEQNLGWVITSDQDARDTLFSVASINFNLFDAEDAIAAVFGVSAPLPPQQILQSPVTQNQVQSSAPIDNQIIYSTQVNDAVVPVVSSGLSVGKLALLGLSLFSMFK